MSERAGARWALPCGARQPQGQPRRPRPRRPRQPRRQPRGAWEARHGAGAWSSLPRPCGARPVQPHGQRARGERAGEGRPSEGSIEV